MKTRLKEQQLLEASSTVKKSDVRRRKALQRIILKRRLTPLLNIASFYLGSGSVPRSLWSE